MAVLPWEVQTVENNEETNIEKVEVNIQKKSKGRKVGGGHSTLRSPLESQEG